MVNYEIDAGGTTVSFVTDVEYGRSEGESIGTATVEVGNTDANRSAFTPGTDVTIKREDTSTGSFETEWIGEVIGTPSASGKRNGTLRVRTESKTSQIEYARVARPFIVKDTGQIVEDMVADVIEPETSAVFVTKGSTTTDWSSNAQNFELGQINSNQVNDFGADILYGDVDFGASGTFYIRNTSLSSDEVPGRRLLKVEMRAIVNNSGNVFSGELEIRDTDGVNYVWSLDIPGYPGFKRYEFGPEDADSVGEGVGRLTTDGACEVRFTIDGGVPETRGFAVDMIRTTPYSVKSRDTALTANADTTSRTITRRLNGSVFEVINELAGEDGAVVYVDNSDTLYYESGGNTSASVSIDYTNSSKVVDANVDRDFDVRNRVTVQGKDDLQATFEDSASIDFYNAKAPKEEPIVDTSIRTKDGLKTRARGFLADNAWEDTAMTFEVGDPKYRDVVVGQVIDVTWPPEDINGTFLVSSVETTQTGTIQIGMTGTTEA